MLFVYAVGIGSFFWSLFRITEVRMLGQKPRARGGLGGHVWSFPLFSVQNGSQNGRDRNDDSTCSVCVQPDLYGGSWMWQRSLDNL